MDPQSLKTSLLLSRAVAGLMVLQSALGLLFPALYRDDLWARSAWHGNDYVTLLVGAPLLVWALVLVQRGSVRGLLLWLGMLGYGVYNYAYYLLGAALNAFFPLYVALLVLPAVTLMLALGRCDARAMAARFRASTPVRLVGGYLAFVGVGLACAWTAQWLAYLLAGKIPPLGVGPFRLVAALDLTLMSPALVAGGVLLWRRAPWGYLLAPIAGIQGATYTLVLTAGSTVGLRNGVPGMAGEIPVWACCTMVTSAAMIALLASVRSEAAAPTPVAGGGPRS